VHSVCTCCGTGPAPLTANVRRAAALCVRNHMSVPVPAKQRAHRILRGLRCYLSPALRFGRPLPKGVALSEDDELLGAIWGKRLESILTNHGAFLRSSSGWQFVRYGDVQGVSFPDKSDSDGPLTLCTPRGNFQLLRRSTDLRSVGRFFMRCAADAKEAQQAAS